MVFIYTFVIIVFLIIVASGWTVYRKTKHFGVAHAVFLGLFTSTMLVLVWPIPIHGGVIFFGEIIYREIQLWQREVEHKEKGHKEIAFIQQYNKQSKHKFDIEPKELIRDGWWQLEISSGRIYYEESAKLYWSKLQPFQTSSPLKDLPAAKALCERLTPKGAWRLPTEIEQYYFWRANGANVLLDGEPSAIAILYDETIQMEIASVNLGKASYSNVIRQTGRRELLLRCVSHSEKTASQQSLKKEISLGEWNQYQMSKLIP